MRKSDLIDELGTNFIEYAVCCNTDRAIPDAKSGLKPVAKRILWAAHQMGAASSKPHIKSATIVGEVIGKYHPHGDVSAYQAMARLAQDWVMRYPLIDWHGSKGSIIGANPAAQRYTEARLSKLSEQGMLENIKKKNVNFGLNFSDTLDEPDTLPSIFPNLLCNPNTGIGIALACNWAPHNLKEVAQAINDYIDGKEPMLPGPDFPTGGIIINKNDIPSIMQTGHGTVKIRGNYKIEKNKIVFYEIPYGLTIKGLLDEFDAIDPKELEGISRVYDDTSKRGGIRLVIECEKSTDPDMIVQQLFLKTSLQSSFSYNQVALVDKSPMELNLKDCIKIYVEHNQECIKRETEYDMKKAEARLHIVKGLLTALEDIDNVIKIIKGSEDPEKDLMATYPIDEIQAKAILDIRLARLAKLEKLKFEAERDELQQKIDSLQNLLESPEQQLVIIKDRLTILASRYGDDRRTKLEQIELPKATKKEKPEIIPEDCVVVITESGLVKRIPTKSFRTQKRNSVGVKNSDDIISYTTKTNTVDTLMVFSNTGRMFRLAVNLIPEGTNVSRGVSLRTLVKMDDNERPIAYSSLKNDTTAKYVFFATKNGIVKRVPLNEYRETKRATGIIALTLRENDHLAAVTFIEDENIMLFTKKGMSIRFASSDLPISSRIAQGVKGITLGEDDEVISCLPIHKTTDYLAIVSADGLGKKVDLKEFNLQGRGGKGLIISKTEVAGAALVDDTDSLLISGNRTSVKIDAKDIPLQGRVTQGVILIKDNDRVVSISKI